QDHFARYDVVCSRQRGYLAYRTHLTAGQVGDYPVYDVDKSRRRQHRVSPLIHRSGAGVIGKARYCYVPIPYSDDSLDHSNIDLFSVELPPLLDVQLEISGKAARPEPSPVKVVRVSPDISYALAYCLPAAGHQVELLRIQPDGCRHAPDSPALFVLKDHDRKRVTRNDSTFVEGLCYFDRAKRPDIPIVVAALRHRIDVGCHYNGSKPRDLSWPATNKISSRIDSGFQAGGPH